MREQFETLEYGSLYIHSAQKPYPLGPSEIIQYSKKRGNQDIASDFESYQYCQKVLTLASAPNTPYVINSTFTLSDIANFVNTIIPNDGVSCLDNVNIRVWDIVDPAIPTFTKVRGINTAFSRLMVGRNKGNRQQYDYNNTINPNAKWNVTNYVTFLRDLWRACWLNTSDIVPPDPFSWTPEQFQCFWIPRRWKNHYQLMPHQALRFENINGQRRVYNEGTQLPEFVTTNAVSVSDGATSAVTVFYTDFVGNPVGGFTANRAFRTRQRLDLSGVIAYPIQEATGYKAVMIKPFGMDSLYTNYYDSSRYEIGFVTYNADNDAYPLLGRLRDAQAQRPPTDIYDQAGPWTSDLWGRKVRSLNRNIRNTKKASTVRFFLRDLLTNRISIFSRGEMRFGATTKSLPPYFRLHVDAHY
jgi:hypothetical protein